MDNLLAGLGRAVGRLLDDAAVGRTLIVPVLVIAGTLILAVAAYRVVVRLIDRLLVALPGAAEDPLKVQRALTLGPLMKSVARYLLAFVALMVILREAGIDIQAILVSAGVIGLAIGLGAQSLIKDVITGFFLLFEGLIAVGDTIEVGPHTGTVEAIGLRVTKLRTLNGAQRIIPNGELTQFANLNRGWARAVVEVGVGYAADVRRALGVLEAVGRQWGQETGWALEPPQAQGIVRFGESEVVLRLLVKIEAPRRVDAEHELRRRIKEAFERERILIPFPARVVYLRRETLEERGPA
jgi:small conductance mechanosensitive channel